MERELTMGRMRQDELGKEREAYESIRITKKGK
jgi:hypothetical protein